MLLANKTQQPTSRVMTTTGESTHKALGSRLSVKDVGRTRFTDVSGYLLLAKAPERCPECLEEIHLGLSSKHSIGLGREGRFISSLSIPCGLAAAVIVGLTNEMRWIAGHVIFGAGLTVGFLVHVMAQTCQKTWRVRCPACGWQAEVVYSKQRRPTSRSS